MSSVYKPIDAYRFWYYGKNDHHMNIQVYHNNQYVGSVTFRDIEPLPDNELDSHGFIRLSMHKNDFPNIMDLLRNESPLFIWIHPDNLIGGLASDANEPVGEGEE